MLSTQKLVNNIMDTSINSAQRRGRDDRRGIKDLNADGKTTLQAPKQELSPLK